MPQTSASCCKAEIRFSVLNHVGPKEEKVSGLSEKTEV